MSLDLNAWDRPVPGDFAARVVNETQRLALEPEPDTQLTPLRLLTESERAERRALIDASIEEGAEASIAAQLARDQAYIDADPARVDELALLLSPTVDAWRAMSEKDRRAVVEEERANRDPRAVGPWERLELAERLDRQDRIAPAAGFPPWEGPIREHERVKAIENVAETMRRLGARTVAEIPRDRPPPLKIGRLDPHGHTILYGDGGTGKGSLTAWWCVQLANAGERVLILDYENHPEEWAPRIVGLDGLEAAQRIAHVAPLTARWMGDRGPLWKQAEDVRELAMGFAATYLVIDSIVPACGGADPMDPGTPALYAGALEYVGLPALSLGHVTKTNDLRYPFGSGFWHHLARVTYSLSRDGARAILAHRKGNNYQRLGKFVVAMAWHEGILREVSEASYTSVLWERIATVLGEDTDLTVAQVVERLNTDVDEGDESVKANSVSIALKRGLTSTPKRFTVTADRWSLAE